MPFYLVTLHVRSPVARTFPTPFPYIATYNWKPQFLLRALVRSASVNNALKMVKRQFDTVESPSHVRLITDEYIKVHVPTWWDVLAWKVKSHEYAAYALNPVQYKLTPYTRLEGRINVLLRSLSEETRGFIGSHFPVENVDNLVQAMDEVSNERGADQVMALLDRRGVNSLGKNSATFLEYALTKAHSPGCVLSDTECNRCLAEKLYNLPGTRLEYVTGRAKAFRLLSWHTPKKPLTQGRSK